MLDVVRSEENMEVCVVRLQRQLHEQKRQMHCDSGHQKEAYRYGPG
jgi:hypothetical protein